MSTQVALQPNDRVMVHGNKHFALIKGSVYAVSRQNGAYTRNATATDEVPIAAINGADHQDEIFEARYLPDFDHKEHQC